MKIREGDHVLVNLAPFIGSALPSKQSIPCKVRGVRGEQVQIVAEPPCREVLIWVRLQWIDGRSGSDSSAA